MDSVAGASEASRDPQHHGSKPSNSITWWYLQAAASNRAAPAESGVVVF